MKRTVRARTLRPRKVSEGVCEVDCVHPDKVAQARRQVPDTIALRRMAEAMRVLGNPNRLRALAALEGKELCVCDLRGVLGISMSGTSQVLRELRNLGAVEFRADGKLAFYRVADPFWLELVKSVRDQVDRPDNGREG